MNRFRERAIEIDQELTLMQKVADRTRCEKVRRAAEHKMYVLHFIREYCLIHAVKLETKDGTTFKTEKSKAR